MDKEQGKIEKCRLQELQEKLNDVKARWPAHSVKPELILKLESLEEEIAILLERLASRGGKDEF